MRAAFYQGIRHMTVEKVDEPTVGPEDVLLRVGACGICGSDLHSYTEGVWIAPGDQMGHEFAGTVLEVGIEVEDVAVGDRVAVCPLVTRGEDDAMRRGRPNLAEDISHSALGGFADRVLIRHAKVGSHLFPLPDHVSDAVGCLLEPAAVGARAVRLADVQADDPVVVIGLGAIGQGAVRALSAHGVKRIIAIDVAPLRLEAARRGGAHLVIDGSNADALQSVYEDLGTTSSPYQPVSGRAAAVIECSGATIPAAQALDMVRPGGTVVFVALFAKPVSVDVDKAVQKELRLQGSFAYTPEDFREAHQLIIGGELDYESLVTHEFELERINDAFSQQLSADEAIKVVIVPDPG